MYEQVLAREHKKALQLLGPVMQSEGFYLAGGTAVALQIGHRRSMDLDWFTGAPLDDALALAKRLQDRGVPLLVRLVRPGTLYADLGGARLAFFEYRYPLLVAPVPWPEYSCPLASLDDLACMKLSAIAQRGAKKDFVDLYALGSRHRPLPELLEAYRRKYRIEDMAHLLYALAYFDDADKERMPNMLWEVDWRTVKRTIRHWVKHVVG